MLFVLFRSFLYVSALTVGGGAAMIPVIHRELVEKHQFLTEEEFLDALGVAQSTPGVLGCNISIIVGYKIAGLWGAIVCVLCAMFPAYLSILLISYFFEGMSAHPYVQKFFVAVKPAVVAVLASAVVMLAQKSKIKGNQYLVSVAVVLAVSFLGISPFVVIFAVGLVHLFLVAKQQRNC